MIIYIRSLSLLPSLPLSRCLLRLTEYLSVVLSFAHSDASFLSCLICIRNRGGRKILQDRCRRRDERRRVEKTSETGARGQLLGVTHKSMSNIRWKCCWLSPHSCPQWLWHCHGYHWYYGLSCPEIWKSERKTLTALCGMTKKFWQSVNFVNGVGHALVMHRKDLHQMRKMSIVGYEW